jgi:hypothetical protein
LGWLAFLLWDFEDFDIEECSLDDLLRDVRIVIEDGPRPINFF